MKFKQPSILQPGLRVNAGQVWIFDEETETTEIYDILEPVVEITREDCDGRTGVDWKKLMERGVKEGWAEKIG